MKLKKHEQKTLDIFLRSVVIEWGTLENMQQFTFDEMMAPVPRFRKEMLVPRWHEHRFLYINQALKVRGYWSTVIQVHCLADDGKRYNEVMEIEALDECLLTDLHDVFKDALKEAFDSVNTSQIIGHTWFSWCNKDKSATHEDWLKTVASRKT